MSTTDAAVLVTHVAVARIRARWSGVNDVPATAVAHASLQDHRGDVVVPDAGHWVQQEAPGAVNAALTGFLDDVCRDRS